MGISLAAGMCRLPSLLVGACPPQPCPAALFLVLGGAACARVCQPCPFSFPRFGISHPAVIWKALSSSVRASDTAAAISSLPKVPEQGGRKGSAGSLCWADTASLHREELARALGAPCKIFQTNLACEWFSGHHLCVVALKQQFLLSSAF